MSAVLSVIGAVFTVLLKIILVFFVLLVFALVCPFCYKGTIDYHGTVLAGGRVFWLCGLVCLSFSYRDGGLGSRIRFFGIDVQKVMAALAARRKKKEASSRREYRSKKTGQVGRVEETDLPEQKEALADTEEEEECKADKAEIHVVSKEEPSGAEFSKTKKSYQKRWSFCAFRRRLSGFFQAVCRFFASIRSIYKKIKKKAEWTGEAKRFWYEENTQRIVCILKDNVLHLWRKLKPKVLRGSIVFGAKDPCTTGQILGAIAVLYASFGRGIQVTPDFEEEKLEGNLLIKGRISLITIGIILIRIFLRGEWKQFRREAEQLKEAL